MTTYAFTYVKSDNLIKKYNIFYDQFRNVHASGVAVMLSFNVQLNVFGKCIYIRLGNMEEERKMGEVYIKRASQ